MECHRAEDTLESLEGIGRAWRTSFEHVIAILSGDDHGVATVCCLARLAETPLELGERGFHVNLTI